MWHRWILGPFLAALLGISASLSVAQSGASLSQRFSGSRQAAPSSRSAGRPAAPPRKATPPVRQAGYQDNAPSGSGGLLGKLNLGRLLPGGGSSPSSNASRGNREEPPMPYDPEELTADSEAEPYGVRPAQGTVAKRPATAGRAPLMANRQPSGGGPRLAAPIARPVDPTGSAVRPSAPSAARRSPASSPRPSELADALEGWQQEGSEQIVESAPELPPATGGEEELPSYLRGAAPSRPRPASREGESSNLGRLPAAGNRSSRDSLDVSRALRAPETPPAPTAGRAQAAATRPAPVGGPAIASTEGRAASPSTAAREDAPSSRVESPAAAPAPVEAPALVRKTDPAPSLGLDAGRPASSGAGRTATEPDREVLLTCQQPALGSRIEGPARMTVGRESRYRVVVENLGSVEASGVAATVEIPAWAEVVGSTASSGVVLPPTSAAGKTQIQELTWRVEQMQPGAIQRLDLQIIPREGRDLPLSVRLAHAPAEGEAVVQVQQPLLHIEITGPADVLYGEAQRYSLSLSNPGTGVAEDVRIELLPPGGDASSLVTHPAGALAPGERKTLELELTAREAGQLRVQASAIAAGGVRAETVKDVLCRKPGLEVDWRGPEEKYAGAIATYYLRVRNPGDAVTPAYQVAVQLPPGADFVGASDGHAVAQGAGEVTWKASGLRPGEEQFMQFQCRFTRAGDNQLRLSAEAGAEGLADEKTITAKVIAMADLELEVADPKGPVAVGEPAAFEIRVRNRGTNAAKGIDVVAYFSDSVEPISADGGEYTVNDGRIAFRTLEELPAGREVVFKISAKAAEAGTRVFRAEVVCPTLDIKLSAEETTKFFVDQYRWENASGAYEQTGAAQP